MASVLTHMDSIVIHALVHIDMIMTHTTACTDMTMLHVTQAALHEKSHPASPYEQSSRSHV